MKALVFDRPGEPLDVLSLRDVPEPTARPGEVLVTVAARPVHPSDLAFVRGTYRIRPTLPQIAGLSGIGRVVDTGARVAFRWPGAWAERVAVPRERLYAVPDDISDDDGAQLPLNPITAWGLLDMADVYPGAVVGLTAPQSSVAQLVAALADMRGVRVLPLPSEVPPKDLAALLDSVGGSLTHSLFPSLRPGATIVAYGTLADEPIPVRNATLIYGNLTWRGFGIDRWLTSLDAEARSHMLATLFDAMRARRLPLPVRAHVPLEDYRRALRLVTEREPGKVLLV